MKRNYKSQQVMSGLGFFLLCRSSFHSVQSLKTVTIECTYIFHKPKLINFAESFTSQYNAYTICFSIIFLQLWMTELSLHPQFMVNVL